MSYVVSFVYTIMVFSSIHQYDCHIFGGIDLFSSLACLVTVRAARAVFVLHCVVSFTSFHYCVARVASLVRCWFRPASFASTPYVVRVWYRVGMQR